MNNKTARLAACQDLESYLKHPTPPCSKKYRYPIKLSPQPRKEVCQVEVVEGNTLDIAKKIKDSGSNPLILNMACTTKPGGGWKNGSAAQEESLFYRSNYYKTLTQDFYPIYNASIIHSTDVTVFRDVYLKNIDTNTQSGKDIEKTPWTVDFMAVAAVKCFDGIDKDEFYNLTAKKIELMFQLGILNGYDTLLLSAFGCGAYRNDPKIIVEIFNGMIQKYCKYYKAIYFGIISLKEVNTRYRGHWSFDNYEYFKENIKQPYTK